MFKNLSFRAKMFVLPAVAGLAFCLVLAVTLLLGQQSKDKLALIESGAYPAIELNRDLEQLLRSLQRALQDATGVSGARHPTGKA